MRNESAPQSRLVPPRLLRAFALCSVAALLAKLSFAAPTDPVCNSPGLTVLTDPAGDTTGGAPSPAHDVRELSIAQPYFVNDADYKIVFHLKMADLSTVPPNTEWPINFCSPAFPCVNSGAGTAPNLTPYSATNKWFTVRMSTVPPASTGPPIFQVLKPTAAGNTAASRTLITADPASGFTAAGLITIVVKASDLGLTPAGAGTDELKSFLTRIAINFVAATLTPDNMPDAQANGGGTFTTVTRTNCEPTVGPAADLSITKTDGATTYAAGGTTTYTIVASNAGPDPVTGALVADIFPPGITSANWTCAGAGGGTCTAASSGNISDTVNLPVGGSVTYTVTANISGSATGNLVNTATVAPPAGVTDPVPANNSATDINTQPSACVPFLDDFEPALAGWVVDTDIDLNPTSIPWAVGMDAFAHSPDNSYNTSMLGIDEKDDRLIAPPQDLSSTSHLIFWHKYNTEATFDGGVLEVSTDGGSTWVDVETPAGTQFISGGYNDVIDLTFGSRIAGREAWTGLPVDPTAMTMVEVDLGAFAGTARLIRWRAVTDPQAVGSTLGDTWAIDDVEFTNLACAPPLPPIPTLVVSRKVHGGGAGPFDIPINPGIECRTGGSTGDHQVLITFPSTVTVTGTPQAEVTSGTGGVGMNGVPNGGAVSINGAVVTVPLTSVGNAQTLTITLNSVSDGVGAGDVPVSMSVLLGDTSADGTVNSGDVTDTRRKSGQITAQSNFHIDMSIDGVINSADVTTVRRASGTSLSP